MLRQPMSCWPQHGEAGAVPQVRQHVHHKRTFMFLEQMILRHGADASCTNIKEIHQVRGDRLAAASPHLSSAAPRQSGARCCPCTQ